MSKNNDNTNIQKDDTDALIQNDDARAITKTLSTYFPIATPLNKPIIDNNFNDLPPLERVTEAIKYNVLCLEYSISPKGGLRQWIKINISLLLLLGIPILIFIPLGTYFMSGFSNITELLSNSTQFLFYSALNILKLLCVLIAIATILWIILKIFIRI